MGEPCPLELATNELRPEAHLRFRFLLRLGRRMSASTKSTRAPCCARAAAQLRLVVVLPSAGKALVMRMTLVEASAFIKRIEVRKERYASATCEFGSEKTAI